VGFCHTSIAPTVNAKEPEFLFPSGRRGWKNLLEFLPATYEILLRVAFSEKNEKMFLVFIFV
jgi:hypothetical protein